MVLHVFRFSPAGRYVSLDWLSQAQITEHRSMVYQSYMTWWNSNDRLNTVPPFSGQFLRGQFLLGLVVWVWVGGFFLFSVAMTASLIHKKRYP